MNSLNENYFGRLMKKVLPYFKILIMLFLIAANFKSLVQQFPEKDSKNDTEFLLNWEKRFVPIKKDIPFDKGVIGYAAEWDIPGNDYSEANAMAEHILTQLTMSPIVVSRDIDLDWVLVNMNIDDFNTWIRMQPSEYEVMIYKYDLYVVHKIK